MNKKPGIDELDFSWFDLVKSVVYLMGEKRKKYLPLLFILFVIQFYSVVPPLIIGKVVDFFTTYQSGDSLSAFYWLTAILGISFSLTSYIRLTIKRLLGNIRTDIIYDIRVKGFERLLSLSWLDSRKEVAGEKAQRIENGTRSFVSLMEQINNEIFQSLTMVIGIFAVFLYLKATYIAFLFAYVIGFFAIIRFFYQKLQQVKYEYNKASEKSGGSYVEGLSNILTIKALGAKKSFGSHIATKEQLKKVFEYRGRRYGIGQWITYQVFNGICIGLFVLLIGRDVVLGSITLGGIVIFYSYLEKLTGSAGQILSTYEDLISSKVSLARMMPIFWDDIKIHSGKKKFPKEWNQLTLSGVNFDYDTTESSQSKSVAIQALSMVIKRNEWIGIAGHTGSGKSTVSKLLLGLLPISSGSYKVDTTNFEQFSQESVIENIGLVLQDTEMFNLSTKDNITLMKKIDEKLLIRAIKIAQLEEVIAKLPEGLNTILGEKGYHLSGGERQRIGIARAICRDPQILIFDEATSSLDSKTEQKIYKAINRELKDKTIILIAHRISTLNNTDKVYVFSNGKLVEEGNYRALISNKKSLLASFYKLQSINK